jgi:hypothetical protein
MKEWNGKPVKKIYTATNKNGNRVGKVFYTDGTTEMVNGDKALYLPLWPDKVYKSVSGLYRSK